MVQILIVDEHGVYRRGLRSLIEVRVRRARVLEAPDLAGAFPIFECEQFIDLVLIDIDSLLHHSRESLREAYDLNPSVRVAVLSASHARADVLSCLAAGFHGFIGKLQSDEDLISAISDLLARRIYVPSWVADGPDGRPEASTMGNGSGIPALTPRQSEVLALLTLGRSNKEIAQELNISEGTTKIHTAALLRSLGARNRTEAVFKAASLVGATGRQEQHDRVSAPTVQELGRVLPLRAVPGGKSRREDETCTPVEPGVRRPGPRGGSRITS